MSEVMTKELLYKLADKDIGQFFAVLNVTNPITGDSFLHYFAGGNTMRDGEGIKSAHLLMCYVAEITIQKTGKMPYELMKK
ncbi:WSSV114 [White spot syndrome virus]|uniref:WSSV114 n=1 Tax=White spot syndrome virus TaxID=342409 RepID=A0A2I6SBP0_9VIRU|nr:WSSV114 [White spot syndrome virus]